MAPLADEPFERTATARFDDLTALTPGRAEFALRLALISALATLVAQIFETPNAALSAYVVFFMLRPDRTSSALTATALLIVISLLIGFLLFSASLVLDRPPLRVGLMVALSLSLLFLASASKLKPLASTIALILAYALDVLGKVGEGELATRALLYTWLIIAIPAAATIVVNLLGGPPPRRLAERTIANRLRAAAAALASGDAADRRRLAALRREDAGPTLKLLNLAALEKVAGNKDLPALRRAAQSTDTLMMVAEAIGDVQEIAQGWRDEAAARLRDMAAILERHHYPIAVQPAPAGTKLHAASARLVADFNAALAGFACPATPASPFVEKGVKGGFFVADAFRNPDHVRYSLKVTAAAMSCYLIYSLADWPGIHTALITCYIVSLDTAAETIEKLCLRIAGALLGAAAGLAALVFLLPHFDRVTGLLGLVFAGALAGGWIAGGGPRIAYAGFQIAFAFFLCVDQGFGPAFDLTIARDRLVGILIGNAAIYLLFAHVWPVSISRRVDPALASLFRRLAWIARRPSHGERREALPHVHAAAAKIAADLYVARYEPASLQPAAGWLRSRRSLLTAVGGFEARLLIGSDRPAVGEARRLEQIAAAIERGDDATAAPDTIRKEQVLAV